MISENRTTLQRGVFNRIRIKHAAILKELRRNDLEKEIKKIVYGLKEIDLEEFSHDVSSMGKLVEEVVAILFVKLARDKNRTAFLILMDLFSGSIVEIIKKNDYEFFNCGNKKEYIDDKLQNIWLKIWKYLHAYNPEKAFYTWIRTVTLNHIKESKNKTEKNTDYFPDYSDETENEGMDIENVSYNHNSEEQKNPEIIFKEEIIGQIILEESFKSSNGYPWHLICFGLSYTVLSMSDSGSSRLGLKPKEIEEKYSEEILENIFEEMVEEFTANSLRPKEFITGIFQELKYELQRTNDQIVSRTDMKTREVILKYIVQKAGNTYLNIYFGKNPTKSISEWTSRTLSKIKYKLKEKGISERAEKEVNVGK